MNLSRRHMLRQALAAAGLGFIVSCSKPAARGGSANNGSHRIVSLSPALSVILRDLGLAGLVVGRHGYEMVLDMSLPVCGDQSGLDYEAIHRLAPTHVLTQYDSGDVPRKLLEMAASKRFETSNFRLLTLQEIRSTVLTLSTTFGGNGEALAGTMDQAFSKRGSGVAAAGRVLLLADTQPLGALGPGSFHHQILERIGGLPALAQGAPFVTLDAEDVIRLAPDGIVLILPRGRGVATSESLAPADLAKLLPGLASRPIPAFKAGRLGLIDDPLSQLPSTGLCSVAERLTSILSGWHA